MNVLLIGVAWKKYEKVLWERRENVVWLQRRHEKRPKQAKRGVFERKYYLRVSIRQGLRAERGAFHAARGKELLEQRRLP